MALWAITTSMPLSSAQPHPEQRAQQIPQLQDHIQRHSPPIALPFGPNGLHRAGLPSPTPAEAFRINSQPAHQLSSPLSVSPEITQSPVLPRARFAQRFQQQHQAQQNRRYNTHYPYMRPRSAHRSRRPGSQAGLPAARRIRESRDIAERRHLSATVGRSFLTPLLGAVRPVRRGRIPSNPASLARLFRAGSMLHHNALGLATPTPQILLYSHRQGESQAADEPDDMALDDDDYGGRWTSHENNLGNMGVMLEEEEICPSEGERNVRGSGILRPVTTARWSAGALGSELEAEDGGPEIKQAAHCPDPEEKPGPKIHHYFTPLTPKSHRTPVRSFASGEYDDGSQKHIWEVATASHTRPMGGSSCGPEEHVELQSTGSTRVVHDIEGEREETDEGEKPSSVLIGDLDASSSSSSPPVPSSPPVARPSSATAPSSTTMTTPVAAISASTSDRTTGRARATTQYRPQFRSKVVCELSCSHCRKVVCERGMRAILLADTRFELFSTDLPPNGVQLMLDDYVTRNCDCRIRDIACISCGSIVGYHVRYPCVRCLDAGNNGHFWMFHSGEVTCRERMNGMLGMALLWGDLEMATEGLQRSREGAILGTPSSGVAIAEDGGR